MKNAWPELSKTQASNLNKAERRIDMTIDEAITHAREVVRIQRNK